MNTKLFIQSTNYLDEIVCAASRAECTRADARGAIMSRKGSERVFKTVAVQMPLAQKALVKPNCEY